jgi:hypothetical protein
MNKSQIVLVTLLALLTTACEKPNSDTKILLHSTTDSGEAFLQAFKSEQVCIGLSLERASPAETKTAGDPKKNRWFLTYHGPTSGGMLFDVKSPDPFMDFGSHDDGDAARKICSIVKQRVWKVER